METTPARKRIILLGSTGSIGTSTLSVVENLPEELEIAALAAGSRWQDLLDPIRRHRPESVALADPRAAERWLAGAPVFAPAHSEPSPA